MYSLDELHGGFEMVTLLILAPDLEISAEWQPAAIAWHRMGVLLKDSAVSDWASLLFIQL